MTNEDCQTVSFYKSEDHTNNDVIPPQFSEVSCKESVSTTDLCVRLLLFAYIKYLSHLHQRSLKLLRIQRFTFLTDQRLSLYVDREDLDLFSNFGKLKNGTTRAKACG